LYYLPPRIHSATSSAFYLAEKENKVNKIFVQSELEKFWGLHVHNVLYGGVTSFRGGTVFVVHLFWHNNSFILIKSPGLLQGI
jgi:hypothetical protein